MARLLTTGNLKGRNTIVPYVDEKKKKKKILQTVWRVGSVFQDAAGTNKRGTIYGSRTTSLRCAFERLLTLRLEYFRNTTTVVRVKFLLFLSCS